MSTCPPPFPAELWLMILGHLQDEPSPQHLARLAQTSRWFYEVVDELLFPIMRFQTRQNAEDFASSMIDCPAENFVARTEVKALVREIRHHGDMGFQNFTFSSSFFYEELATFSNLETLIMRPKWSPANQGLCSTEWGNLVYDLCMDPDREDWREEITLFFNLMERRFGADALDDPFDSHWCPEDTGYPDEEHVRAEMTRFCDGFLEGGLPRSLISCHIGTDSLQKPGDPISTFFNWSICDLTQIKTLCITGANFNDLDTHAMRGRGRMAALEELKLLNCRMSPDEMVTMIESAASLKKVTIRGPNCSDPDGEQDAQYTEVSGVLEEYFSGSLEELDIDIYWGTPSAMCLHAMRSLKKLTVTMYTLLGSLNDDPRLKLYEIVPQSLETLVVRHEAGITLPFHQVHEALFEGKLPNLRSMVFQIPENIRVSPTTPSLQRRAQDFVSQFHSMGVELQVCLVPYPTVIGGYDACPCECLEVYHRFPFHPWGDSGFAYDDCSDDADMYEEEEDDESEGESTGEDGESESSENDGSGEESQEQGERGIPFLEDLGARCDTVIDTHEEYLRWVDGSK